MFHLRAGFRSSPEGYIPHYEFLDTPLLPEVGGTYPLLFKGEEIEVTLTGFDSDNESYKLTKL